MKSTTDTVIVLNPNASQAEQGAPLVLDLARARGWRCVETQAAGEATERAREAVRSGAQRVIAGGGDGTVFEVVEGLLDAGEAGAELGVLPLGTGNDLARSLGMPLDAERACAWLAESPEARRRIDVIEVRADGGPARYAINCVNGGVANRVREELDDERKRRWGPLAYVAAAVDALGELEPWAVTLSVDGGAPVMHPATFSVVAANGASVGGGHEIAPGADLESGAFELVVVRGERLTDILSVALRAKLTEPHASELVHRRSARRAEIVVPDGFAFTVDGEALDAHSLELRILPGALPVVAGPLYGAVD